MTWKCICSDIDLLCYQKLSKQFSVRIEARKQSTGWKIYKSYFNEGGLNVTDNFEAKDRNEMESLLTVLRGQREPSLKNLQQRMLEDKRSIALRLERAYKEYNVEKWYFTVNLSQETNFIILRYDDVVEVDVVLAESLQSYEQSIGQEVARILGFNPNDEDIAMRFYYFKKVHDRALPPKAAKEHVQAWFSD